MSGALSGIKVLEMGLLIQGPQAAALLSDMGADVIKLELPNIGDQGRYIFLSPEDMRSAVFTACNRGKKSVTIDLRTSGGTEVFKSLVKSADVVISNFKPGTLEEWGLGYDELQKINAGIICASGSTFGPVGPDAQREGADLAGQSAGGLVKTTGRDGDPPSPVGAFIADHIGSLNMVAGILAALHARNSSGLGQQIEVSLLGGQIWAQASEYTHYLMTKKVPGRSNFGHPMIKAAYRIFQTKDGWLGIIGVPPDARDAFFLAIERPDLALDERTQGPIMAPEVLSEFITELEKSFLEKTTLEWCEILKNAGVRYAPVRDYAEVVNDEGVRANGYISDLVDIDGSLNTVVGSPIKMSRTPLTPGALPPDLGADTDEILKQEGFDKESIERLRKEGAV